MEFLKKEDFLEELKNFDLKSNKIFFIFEENIYSKEDFDIELHCGFDLRNKEKIELEINQTKIAKCGVKWAAPLSVYLSINIRSGISFKTPLRLANNVGIVESSYRNEIGLLLTCYSLHFNKEIEDISKENNKIIINKGVRLAQAIVLPLIKHKIPFNNYYEIYYTFDNELFKNWEEIVKSKRKGGFGSTGVK